MNKMSAASTLLTCLGAVGVVATSILVAKATPKAKLELKKAEVEKGEKLTKIEIVKAAGPSYIPSIIMGASTIGCIFGANILNKKVQASMASAYALLDRSFKEYVGKVKELYGEDADFRVRHEVASDKYEEYEELPDGEMLFFDYNSMQYFVSTIDQVIQKTEMEDGMECYIISTPFDTIPSMMSCW